jgi:hypothetical protein
MLSVVPTSAADVSWGGIGDDAHATPFNANRTDEYTNIANWIGGTAIPSASDNAVFGVNGLVQKVNVSASVELVKIIFSGANTGTSSKSYTLSGSTITVNGGIDAIMTGNGGEHAVKNNITLNADATFKTTGSNTLAVGDTNSVLALGTNDLILDAGGGTISILGKITGSGTITKSGTGKVEMLATPGAGGFTGAIAIPSGGMAINDDAGVNVAISGGTLMGTGTVGTVTMSSGGIAPGNSPGTLNTGNLTFTGGTHAVELGGKADGEFDKLNVTGTVDLGEGVTTLDVQLVNSFTPAVNDSFVIIENDEDDEIEGTFKDLEDGDTFTLGSYTYQINYDGGDGNDVVLLVTGAAAGSPSTPDTGLGSLLGSPIVTLLAAVSVVALLAGHRVYEMKKVRK